MGKASRAARRAERKSNRADKKRSRADEAQQKGQTKRAARLRARADKLDARADVLNNAVKNGIIRGLFGQVVAINELGYVTVQATWTFDADDLASQKTLELTIAPSFPFQSGGQDHVVLDPGVKKHSFGPMKNIRYTLKLFGVNKYGLKTLLDRTSVKKS